MEEIKRKNIGKRLEYIRKRLGLSRKKMAEKLGVSDRTIQRYEKGETRIPATFLKILEEQFDVNTVWLISEKGPIFKHENKVKINVADSKQRVDSWKITPGCFAVIAPDNSMSPLIPEGGIAIVSPFAEINNGNLVAIKKKDGKFIIRRLLEIDGNKMIVSISNPVPAPLEDYEKIYRVILISL